MRKSAEKALSAVAALAKAALAAAAVLLLLAVCALLLRVRIATAAARALLPHGPGLENAFSIRRLGLRGLEITDARLGGFPFAPSFSSLKVEWSPRGLLAKRIDSITVEGIGIDAAHAVPGFRFPSLGAAGEPAPRRDVLMGWTVYSLSAATVALDFSPLVPTNSPLPPSSASARLSLSSNYAGGRYRCGLEGALAGLPLRGSVEYTPADARGTASLELLNVIPKKVADIPLEGVALSAGFSFAEARGIDCTVSGELQARPCAWAVPFDASLRPDGSYSVSVKVASIPLSKDEPLVGTALFVAEKFGGAAVPAELSFSCEASASLSLDGGPGAPSWKADGDISGLEVAMQGGAFPFSLEGGRLRGGASGSGGLVAFQPARVSFASASAGLIPFGRGRATLMAGGGYVVVSEASVGFCGGAIRLYAVSLDLENLAAGFTVFLDGLRLADAISLFPQLEGSSATGQLYGRLPLRLSSDLQIRLGEGFVYTPPGETGTLKLSHPEYITGFLAQAGLPPPVCDNFSKALRNLDYDVLRLDLANPRGDDGRVAIRLQGKSPDGKVVTPVNINANVNGPIEKFLNLAVKTARMAAK